MKLRHILSTQQFLDDHVLAEIFQLATEVEKKDRENNLSPVLKGKMLATIFYEPSTRTRFSFESAMQKLGGSVISTENAHNFSSAMKGESLQDTIRTVCQYADVIILRHSEEGSSEIAARFSAVPVINAGDGTGEHPTQALLDLYTIWKKFGKIASLNIAFVGDLLYGRTIHSLVYLLSLYKGIRIYFISPRQLRIPEKYKTFLNQRGVQFEERRDLGDLRDIDILYVTRTQKERFSTELEYENVKNSYIITRDILQGMKENAIIMHPLPRVTEIEENVDDDKRAVYFEQVKNGLYIRMALLQMMLT